MRGLLTLWGYFLGDPDSTLADEMVGNFGRVFNDCDFDMVYFDASDGVSDAYLGRSYYLNSCTSATTAVRKDVLYQTSNAPARTSAGT